MYSIQNFKYEPASRRNLQHAAISGDAIARKPRPRPLELDHPPVGRSELKNATPADSMLIVPEAGSAAPSESPSEDEEIPQAPSDERPVQAAPEPPFERLGGGEAFRSLRAKSGFSPIQRVPPSFTKKAASRRRIKDDGQASHRKTSLLKTKPAPFDKNPIPPAFLFAPPDIHQNTVPAEPFWNDERKRKGLISGLVALAGVAYLLIGLGRIPVGKSRSAA